MSQYEGVFMRYVTYLENGLLDGCYLQVPPPEHINRMLPFPEEHLWMWASFRANADRSAIELIPEDEMPGYEPPEEPEDPPVDPGQPEGVQSAG